MRSYLRILIMMVWKNLRIVFRSKTSSLIIFLGPLLIIGIIGAAFNSSEMNNIKIGVYYDKMTESIETMKDSLEDSRLRVFRIKTKESCIDQVKDGNLHACIIFPEGFDLENPEGEKNIEFAIDFSRINIAWLIWDTLMSKIKSESTDFSLKLVEAMMQKINETSVELNKSKERLVEISSNGDQISLKITDIKDDLIALDLNISVADLNLSEFENQSSTNQAEIDSFKEEISGVQSQIDSAREGMIQQREESLGLLTDFEEKLSGQISDLEESKATKEAQMPEVCAADPTSQECMILQIEIPTIDSQITLLSEYLTDVQGNIESIEGQEMPDDDVDFSGMNDRLDSFNEKMQKLNEKTSKFEGELGKIKNKTDEIKAMKNSTLGELDDIDDIMTSNFQTTDEFIDAIDELTRNMDNLTLLDSRQIIFPIRTRYKDITDTNNYFSFMFPPLLVLVVMLISILLSSTTVITEKQSKAHFRNFLAPVHDLFFIISHFISNILILSGQTIILLLVAVFGFGVEVSNWFSIIGAFLIINSFFVLIGLLIGYLFNSEETATLGSISVSCVFLLFSSLVIPIETMQKQIGFIAFANPFVLSESIIRKIIIFDKTLFSSPLEVYVLLLYIVITFICVFLLYRNKKGKVE
ncbi:MAG: ABC transporter permease [Candidatus Woesearchaeota archaeon]